MHRRVGLSVRPACVHTALECRDQRSSCSDSVFSSLTAGMYFLSDYLNPLSSRSVAATVAHREISPHSRAKVTSRRRGWQKSPAGYAGRVGHHGHMAASGDLLGAAPGARGGGPHPVPKCPQNRRGLSKPTLSAEHGHLLAPPPHLGRSRGVRGVSPRAVRALSFSHGPTWSGRDERHGGSGSEQTNAEVPPKPAATKEMVGSGSQQTNAEGSPEACVAFPPPHI